MTQHASPKNDFNKPDVTKIARNDLTLLLAPYLQIARQENSSDLGGALRTAIRWLEDGFKNETEKGSLYHALHFSMEQLAQAIEQTPDSADTVTIKTEYLENIKAAACQLNEAALQVGGVPAEQRNVFLPNLGLGHAEDHLKFHGDLLRELAQNFHMMLDKLAIDEADDAAIDRYIDPSADPRFR